MEKNKTITDWAENEINIAMNSHKDKEMDGYMKDCYKSALKAYRSLEEDGHSGASIQCTRYILDRLIQRLPLTPITEDDFKDEDGNLIKDEDALVNGTIQCPRYTSLFRYEEADGMVRYRDLNQYAFKISGCGGEWSGRCNFYERENPITLPYFPANGHATIYVEEYSKDMKKTSDWHDVRHIFKVKEVDGSIRDVDVWEVEENNSYKEIGKQELGEMIDKIHDDLFHAYCEDCNGDSTMIACKLLDIRRERLRREGL